MFKAMAEAWGAKPTPMNFGELYLALKQGVVDGQENPLPTIKSGKFDEVQKYLVLSAHIITPRLVVINEAFWQGLSAGDRKIIADAVKNGIAWQNAELIKQEGTLVDTFKAAGVTVITPDVNAFKAPVHREGAEDVRVEVGRRHLRQDPGGSLSPQAPFNCPGPRCRDGAGGAAFPCRCAASPNGPSTGSPSPASAECSSASPAAWCFAISSATR